MSLKKKICGITGSNGNLGSEIIKNKKFKFVKFIGDITNKKDVNNWIVKNNFDLLIHLAAVVPVKKVSLKYTKAKKVNYIGTKNLVDAIIRHKPNLKWFFFASTSHVYNFSKIKIKENQKTRPVSKYGSTKVMAENYIKKKIKENKIRFCIGRIFSFYSINQSLDFIVPALKNKISKSNQKVINLENLNHFRDFIKIKKIVKIIFFLYDKNFNGTINIASGKKILLKKIAIKINKGRKKIRFSDSNISTSLIANINKLKKIGFKDANLNPF